jgi:hypothetical protein
LNTNEKFGFDLLSELKLERMIDCIEKIAFYYHDLKPDLISSKFKDYCDVDLKKLPDRLIKEFVTNYWRK